MNNTVKWIIAVIIVVAIVWFGFMNKTDDQEEVVVTDDATADVVVDAGTGVPVEAPAEEVAQ